MHIYIVLKNQKVLEYIDTVLERRHQGNRCAEHLTSTVDIEFTLFDNELAHLWNLSADAFSLLLSIEENTEDPKLGRQLKFARMQTEWT